jgi:hypothetical protein
MENEFGYIETNSKRGNVAKDGYPLTLRRAITEGQDARPAAAFGVLAGRANNEKE